MYITNSRVAIPVRWFTRENQLFAQCWKTQVVQTYEGPAWQAVISPLYTISASEFLRPYPELQQDMLARPDAYDVPLASKMHSELSFSPVFPDTQPVACRCL